MSGIPVEIPDWSTADEPLHQAVHHARTAWRRRVLLEGAVATIATALGALVALVLLADVVGVTPELLRLLRVLFYATIAIAIGWWLVRPMVRRVDEARMAMYLEEREPGLGQSVLSAVRAVGEPVERRPSPALSRRLAVQATGALDRLGQGGALEATRVRTAGVRLVAVVLAAAALLVLGPAPWRELAGGMLAPWTPAEAIVPAREVTVVPGDVTIPRGSSLDIEAVASGFTPSEAVLLLRRRSDAEWTALPMLAESDGRHVVRLFDLDSTTIYVVEAGDVRSREHRITVTDLPAVRRVGLQLEFPAYTALPAEVIEDGGDVAAVIGTVVEVRTAVTMPVRAATLRFDDGTRIPLALVDSLGPVGRFRVTRNGFYSIDLEAPDGTEVAGTVRWAVDALPDRPPVVRVFDPGRDIRATNIEEVSLAIGADDDYGVRSLALRFSINGGEEREVVLADGYPAGTLDPRGVHVFYLEELGLAAGDLVAYHAVAIDGAGNEARSDLYFVEIRPFSRNYRQAEQGGGGGGGGQGGESPQQLSREQRELIVATYNVKRDSAGATPERLREDIATLAVGQERLRDQLRQLSSQLEQRGAASVDSNFVEIKAALDSAAVVMGGAIGALREDRLDDALPDQQRALQQIQRGEAIYRDVELQLNQDGGGGGGGGGGAPEDLADLFELETDKLRNQYEAVQRESAVQEQTAREVDEARERLRDLARRLEQENERQRRMAEAMQERLAQAGAGGGEAGGAGGGQAGAGGAAAARRFAEEAEAEARRLERLARERNTPELDAAARQARQAADQLRRAAAGQAGEAGAAAESLREAARGVADGQESAARRVTQELAGRAAQLRQDHQEFGRQSGELPVPGDPDRSRATEQLRAEGEQMVRDAESLVRDLDRTARDVRGTDPRVAAGLGDAANRMREFQVPERLEYANRMATDDRISPQMRRDFNAELGRVLDEVRDRIAGAAGAVGAAPERQRDRALENARELVRGMQALRDRSQAAAARDSAGQGAPVGRQGQGEGQGRGEGQGQGQGEGQGQGQGERGQPGERADGATAGGQRAGGGDARQLRGEVQTRLREAQALRDDLRALGLSNAALDDGIATLRRLLQDGVVGDPLEMASLQEQALDALMRAEFDLWQRIGGGESGRPAVGDPSRVPPRYRQMVEEYYRAIARDRP
jgi:hypothetical protein